MLYKYEHKSRALEPVKFKNVADFGNQEKDLENLIVENLSKVHFEENRLMLVCQSERGREEADIYALNSKGELVIFELKRGAAGVDAVLQILRYAQNASRWDYHKLQEQFQRRPNKKEDGGETELTEAHAEYFGLPFSLAAKEINNRQHLRVIGSVADDHLVKAIDYWKEQGVSIEFLPYRIYEFGEDKDKYFEFFALPYDKHQRHGDEGGVLVDTNYKYHEERALLYMIENKCVATFGDHKDMVRNSVSPGDTVFFCRSGIGIVAAAKVKEERKGGEFKEVIKTPVMPNLDQIIGQRGVDFLTDIQGENNVVMPYYEVRKVLGMPDRGGFRGTIKRRISKEEAEALVRELKSYIKSKKG